jgi:hypothetical protein
MEKPHKTYVMSVRPPVFPRDLLDAGVEETLLASYMLQFPSAVPAIMNVQP